MYCIDYRDIGQNIYDWRCVLNYYTFLWWLQEYIIHCFSVGDQRQFSYDRPMIILPYYVMPISGRENRRRNGIGVSVNNIEQMQDI